MSYRQSYLSQGDPGLGSFFGGIFGLGTKLAKGALGLGGGGASKKEIEQLMKDKLAGGIKAPMQAIATGGRAVAGYIGKHKGISAAAAAALAAGLIPAGYVLTHSGKVRRKPHMQVTNTRALRRSMRRVQGFARIAQRTMTFTKRHHLKKHRARR